jgi:hypothetical protein
MQPKGKAALFGGSPASLMLSEYIISKKALQSCSALADMWQVAFLFFKKKKPPTPPWIRDVSKNGSRITSFCGRDARRPSRSALDSRHFELHLCLLDL